MVTTGKRVAKDGETTITFRGQVNFKAKFTIDPTKKPKTIDYKMTEGPTKGKTHLGIYELDGDTVKFCFAAHGEGTPDGIHRQGGKRANSERVEASQEVASSRLSGITTEPLLAFPGMTFPVRRRTTTCGSHGDGERIESMCMVVYIASDYPLPTLAWNQERPGFHIAELSELEEPVRRQFSKPFVYYAGSHEMCGCGFQYGEYEGYDEDADLPQKRASRQQLAEFLAVALQHQPEVEVFACWDGDRAVQPEHRGRVRRRIGQRPQLLPREGIPGGFRGRRMTHLHVG